VKLNNRAILGFLWIGEVSILDDSTFIEGIRVTPLGNVFTYDLETWELSFYRYYEVRYESKITYERDRVESVHRVLLESVKETLKFSQTT